MLKINKKNLIESIEGIKDLNVLVIGETIIDEYQFGYTLGKSGKAPIVAFQNENIERYNGGVLAIQNHLKTFCNIDILTGWRQIIKKRYIQNGQKLFETYSFKEDLGYNKNKDIGDYDLVIVADFGHGFITKDLRNEIEQKAKFISLNCQINAGNMGLNSINKYKRANYICVSEHELRLAYSEQFSDIKNLIKENIKKDIVLSITRGKQGCTIYRNGNFITFPALEKNPIDPTGAGDAYLSITSPLVYKGYPIEIIGYIGSIAGAIVCSYQGNKEFVTKEKILKCINES